MMDANFKKGIRKAESVKAIAWQSYDIVKNHRVASVYYNRYMDCVFVHSVLVDAVATIEQLEAQCAALADEVRTLRNDLNIERIAKEETRVLVNVLISELEEYIERELS